MMSGVMPVSYTHLDGLGSKVLYQFDLLVGEWPDFRAVDDNRADQIVVLEHRHGGNGPRTTQLGEVGQCSIAFGVTLLCDDIGDVCYLPRPRDAAHWTASRRREKWLAPARLGKRARDIVHGYRAKAVALGQAQYSELGPADSHRVFQHGIEYRL